MILRILKIGTLAKDEFLIWFWLNTGDHFIHLMINVEIIVELAIIGIPCHLLLRGSFWLICFYLVSLQTFIERERIIHNIKTNFYLT
jgi:hypothetical protein